MRQYKCIRGTHGKTYVGFIKRKDTFPTGFIRGHFSYVGFFSAGGNQMCSEIKAVNAKCGVYKFAVSFLFGDFIEERSVCFDIKH